MLAETFSMTGWKYLRLQCFLIFNVSFGLKKIHLSCLSLKILFYWREKKKMYFFKAYKSSKLLFVIITVTKERQELLTWDNYLFFPIHCVTQVHFCANSLHTSAASPSCLYPLWVWSCRLLVPSHFWALCHVLPYLDLGGESGYGEQPAPFLSMEISQVLQQ